MKQVSKKNKKNIQKTVKKTVNVEKDKHLKKIIKYLILLIFIVGVTIAFVVFSGLFNISEIIVNGNEHISKEQIISYSKILYDKNIFSISNSKTEEKIRENSYVKNVNVKKILPNKIEISVEEREVKFMARIAENYVYINEQGYILEFATEPIKAIELIGLKTELVNITPDDLLNENDLENIKEINKIIDMSEKNDILEIDKIDFSELNDYVIILENEGKKIHVGSCENLNEKFLYIKAILKAQKGKKGEIFVNVNLNEGEYAYFREE